MNSEQFDSKNHIFTTVENRDLQCDSENIPQNSTHCSLIVCLQPPFISIYSDFSIMTEDICLGKE